MENFGKWAVWQRVSEVFKFGPNLGCIQYSSLLVPYFVLCVLRVFEGRQDVVGGSFSCLIENFGSGLFGKG